MARQAVVPDTIDPIMVGRARDLLEKADLLAANADAVPELAERFRQYYLAALRAAGAALAIHEPRVTGTRRRTPTNAWSRIAAQVPELTRQAAWFADRSALRTNIETGLIRDVDVAHVASLRRRLIDFLDDVEALVNAYEQGRAPAEDSALGRSA